MLPTGDQVFKHIGLWGHFTLKPDQLKLVTDFPSLFIHEKNGLQEHSAAVGIKQENVSEVFRALKSAGES